MLAPKELRHSPRIEVPALHVEMTRSGVTLRGNISSGGVGFEIESAHRLRIGDAITVRVQIPEFDEAVELDAVVCHVQHAVGRRRQYVGARFDGVDELLLYPLDRWVEESALLDATRSISVH
ncbi:MAG: PilZ domain-containing protein [Myxococcota bacterium]